MSQTKISPQIITIQQFMENTLIPGIRKMQAEHLAFLSFGIIAVSIEILGSFFDKNPFDRDGDSKNRFRRAIEILFKPLGKGYDIVCPCKRQIPHDDYCLFRGLRCGMTHIGRPQGKIAFTTRKEARANKNTHLHKDSNGFLILVAEDLADDFVSAWEILKGESAKGRTKKKVTDPYLKVYSYDKEEQA